jgi:hypothetical protein
MKISDKINQVLSAGDFNNQAYYSFEYFPPKTEQGIE